MQAGVVWEVGVAIAAAVMQYNESATEEGVPSIDILPVCHHRDCIYNHPGASRRDVAESMVRGLVSAISPSASGGLAPHMPRLDFAVSEFRRAKHRTPTWKRKSSNKPIGVAIVKLAPSRGWGNPKPGF